MTTLADLTTLRVGGPIAEYVRVSTTDSLVEAVRAADASGGPLLVVGGGSNLLASDAPFEGTVVDVQPFGEIASIIDEGPSGSVLVRADAGTVWDEFVSWTLSQGLSGVEALSGIPGTVGASPVQNVGAYGHEVAETISSVEAYDRLTGDVVRLMPAELGFAYRSSAIKRSVGQPGLHDSPWGPTGRWVVLSVDFRLERSPLSAPVMYSELARRLDVEAGSRADASLVRSTVLDLRRGKGMVLDSADHDTWSAGSFFTNPILSEAAAAALPEGAPRFSAGEGLVKTSAAWLIDHAGCGKGFHLPEAGDPPCVSLSTKHVLALTNRGNATGADIEALARAVRECVYDAFGVTLVPEPVTVGITW